MAKKEKGFVLLALIVVLIFLALLAIAAFFVYIKSSEFSGSQNQPTQNSQEQVVVNQQAQPNLQDLEKNCINSGGTVGTATCYCPGTADFYNTCAIGGCTCTPDPTFKREIKICQCPDDKCFNGTSCSNR